MISNVALFFILLPYIGIAALPSDIQPFAVLFAIFIYLYPKARLQEMKL